jgi:5-methyltetrahydropteroyltriglutamate--homocysteine methyltransferase
MSRLALEFAAPASEIAVLAKFLKYKVLGLGVIDHFDSAVVTPEKVVSRVEAALRYVPPERITLNPDCRFSPGSQNPMDFDEVYLKLKALCKGAAICRERFG